MSDEAELESPKPEDVAALWKRMIATEQKRHKNYKDKARDAQEAYDKDCSFNIAWPSVQVMLGSLYSSTPDPEARRRQRDGDKAQKSAAQVLERAISFCTDMHDYDGNVTASILDFLVAGMGQGKITYSPEFGTVQTPIGPQETITAQIVETEHFSWKHFGWEPCKSWKNVNWIYFEHEKSKGDIKKEYGLSANEESDDDSDTENKFVKVYEIWHKPSRAIILIAEQFQTPLEVRADKLGLRGFFPCSQPMFTNLSTDKLIPSPDFNYYSKQYMELNKISTRLTALNESIRAASFYDSHFQELAKLKKGVDGDYIPVDDLASKVDGMNLESVLCEVPLSQRQSVVAGLTDEKMRLISEVYEILGISDIQRGESNASEGVQTQQLKAEMGSVRMRDKQIEVNRFCRDQYRIMGEVIAEHFEPEILQKITGIQIDEQIMAILRDDFTRNVSIEIETDSTSAGDKARNRQVASETLQTTIKALLEVMAAASQGLPKPIAQELSLMIVRSVDGSTGNLEDAIAKLGEEGSPEMMVQQLQQQLQQMRQEADQRIQGLEQELSKHNQADTAKDMSAAQLNSARAQEIQRRLPGDQAQQAADIEQTHVETSGKRVEQAANLNTAITGREPFIRGVE